MRCGCDHGKPPIDCGDGCGCVYVYGTNQCICECFGDGFHVGKGVGGITLATQVDVTFRGAPLTQMGMFLERFFPGKIHIPAAKAQTKVSLKLKKVSFSKVIKSSGLVLKR